MLLLVGDVKIQINQHSQSAISLINRIIINDFFLLFWSRIASRSLHQKCRYQKEQETATKNETNNNRGPSIFES